MIAAWWATLLTLGIPALVEAIQAAVVRRRERLAAERLAAEQAQAAEAERIARARRTPLRIAGEP